MKNPFGSRPAPVDADGITDTIERALASAGLDTQAGPMRGVMDTIRQALGSSPPAEPAPEPQPGPEPDTFEAGETGAPLVDHPDIPVMPTQPVAAGRFESYTHGNAAGRRNYKLYQPARDGAEGGGQAVLVMLHGCTQSPDDFALGTQMNRLADEHGFLVVYPEQPAQANPSKCWNWFQPQDQARDAGEPSLIAGIAGEVLKRHGADPRRVFVAGLSAGAAMAVVMGETYPDVFAGVGAHSGLPYAAAHDIPSALSVMKHGRSGLAALRGLAAPPASAQAAQAVPLIVFHGDRDHTVQHDNATALVAQAAHVQRARLGPDALTARTQVGRAGTGRGYSRTVHVDNEGRTLIEAWTLHGAGHAWSGGDARGSYTDAGGPDASAEMVRFFLALGSPVTPAAAP